ncbi:hypothetical protein [Pelagibacterium montanilacus]|uniref:hypothetical protein n=1 Tax=Pelagibacterium montanilacus TaxID=2185280 RepID=UPI000F8D93AA|nr:hypothetical protein [Pelagibacterium montanilacus]
MRQPHVPPSPPGNDPHTSSEETDTGKVRKNDHRAPRKARELRDDKVVNSYSHRDGKLEPKEH